MVVKNSILRKIPIALTAILLSLTSERCCTDASAFEPSARQLPPAEVGKDSLEKVINMGLRFLAKEQQKQTIWYSQFRGEWPSYMAMIHTFPFFGLKGKRAYDSNCFVSANIQLILSQVYLRGFGKEQIPSMLELSMENLLRYKDGNGFGFWQKLPQRFGFRSVHLEVPKRRPNNFRLSTALLKLQANVANDADDTALGYLAWKLYNQIAGREGLKPFPGIGSAVPQVFDRYRDRNRANIHFMQLVGAAPRKTGAWLTWLEEEQPFNPFIIPGIIPSLFRYNIPWNANDLCSVVNANVMSCVAGFGRLEQAAGYDDACAYLNELIKDNDYRNSTIYYPNRYQLPYSAAKAFHFGASCLQPSFDSLLAYLHQGQHPEGFFVNHYNPDTLQSTLYALNAMLLIANARQESSIQHQASSIQHPASSIQHPASSIQHPASSIQKAMRYVLDQMQRSGDTVSWPGGICFSAGSLVKHDLVWKSQALTTALALEAISLYYKLL